MSRPSVEEAYFATAMIWARRSTCLKRRVGAVLVKNGYVIATGYNGAPPGWPHCEDVGCYIVADRCERCVHAEVNAILQAARHGHPTDGAVLYSTLEPCHRCRMVMVSAGVAEWHFMDEHTSHHDPEKVRS